MRVNAESCRCTALNSRLIEHIYEVIEAKGGIPYGEVKRVLYARIDHWNRQAGMAAVLDKLEIPASPTLENQR